MAPCAVRETIVPWKDFPTIDGEYDVKGGNVEFNNVFFVVSKIRRRVRSTFKTYRQLNSWESRLCI